MYEAHLQYDYTLKYITEYIGIYYTTVSISTKKMGGNIKDDIARPYPIFLCHTSYSVKL